MSSEDEYYIDLYERHRDSRASRRARRRGSRAQEQARWERKQDRLYTKGRKRRVWIAQKTARIGGIILIVLFILYELYVLQKAPRSKGNRATRRDGTTGRYGSNNGPPPAQAAAPKPAEEQPHQAAPQQPPADPVPSPVAVKAPPAAPAAPAAQEAPPAAPRAAPDPPARDAVPIEDRPADAETVVKQPAVRRRRRRKKKRHRSEGEPETRSPPPRKKHRNIEDEPADAEDGSTPASSSGRKASKGSARASSDEGGVGEKKAKRRKRKRKGKKRGAGADHDSGSESGKADPGASENFWQWFQESKHSEGGGASAIQCPEDNHKLCQMFYKNVRKHKIRSVFDASCGKNLDWMQVPLRKIEKELWGFKYICGESSEDRMAKAKDVLADIKLVEFDTRQWWREGFPDDVEMLFAWDTLAHTAFGRVWSFFVFAKKQEVKWVLVDNYPAIMNDPSPKREFINLRRHPFRFPAPFSVVQDVREPGEDEAIKRQLLLYEGDQLPENLGG